jgi:hypothetical protein
MVDPYLLYQSFLFYVDDDVLKEKLYCFNFHWGYIDDFINFYHLIERGNDLIGHWVVGVGFYCFRDGGLRCYYTLIVDTKILST